MSGVPTVRLNDLILAYLTANSIVAAPNSYVVALDPNTFVESIVFWDTGSLGAQPSAGTLNGYLAGIAIQQSAQSDYATNIAKGIAITSTGTPALNASYALDPVTLSQIQALATDCAAGFGFPGGAGTFAYPDLTGTPHTFNSTSIVNLYKAMRGIIFSMQVTLAARLQGTNTSWPSQASTIP